MKFKANAMGFSKPLNVKPSIKNYKRTNKMLIKTLKMKTLITKIQALDPSDDKYVQTTIDMFEAEDAYMDDGFKFLQDTFRLNPQQMKTAEEHLTNSNQLAEYISYVIQRIKGASDQQIEADNKRTRQERKENPKK